MSASESIVQSSNVTLPSRQELRALLDPRWNDVEAASYPIDFKGDDFPRSPIAMGAGVGPTEVVSLAATRGFRHVAQGEGQDSAAKSVTLARELNLAALMLSDPELFLAFPLSSTIDPRGAGQGPEADAIGFESSLVSIGELPRLRATLENYLGAAGAPENSRSDALMVADELVTNALVAGPYVLEDDQTSPGFDPDSSIVPDLPQGVVVRVFAGVADGRLLIGCEDPFGTLDPRKLLARVHRCCSAGAAENMRWGVRNAGLGSMLVYERSSTCIYAVAPGRKTIVLSALPIGASFRLRQSEPKSLHWMLLGQV